MKFTIALIVTSLSFAAFAQTRASISYSTPAPAAAPSSSRAAAVELTSAAETPKPAVLSGMQDSASAARPLAKPATASTSTMASPKRRVTRKAAQKKRLKSKEVVAPEVLENQAMKELMLPKEDLSTGVLPTPATVRSRIETLENPVHPLEYRLGVSIQPFTPKGTMPVTDLMPYDLEAAGTGAMFALDGQWLPLHFEKVSGLEAGPFVSIGYAQFNLALRSPTGVQLENTKLHAIKVQLGATASYQLPNSPLWSVHGNLGIGRLQLIQSSSAAYANTSSAMNFVSFGVAGERALSANLSVYLGYDLRLALSRATEGADVPNHNFLVGVLGNFE